MSNDYACQRCYDRGDPQATAGCPACHRTGPIEDDGLVTPRRATRLPVSSLLAAMGSIAIEASMHAPPARPDFEGIGDLVGRGVSDPLFGRRTPSAPRGPRRASPEKKQKRKATKAARKKNR